MFFDLFKKSSIADDERMYSDVSRVINDRQLSDDLIDELGLLYMRFVHQRYDIHVKYRKCNIPVTDMRASSQILNDYLLSDVFNLNDYDPRLITDDFKNLLHIRFSYFPVIEENIHLSHFYLKQGDAWFDTGFISDRSYDRKYKHFVTVRGLVDHASDWMYDVAIPGIMANKETLKRVFDLDPDFADNYFSEDLCRSFFSKMHEMSIIGEYNSPKSIEWATADEIYREEAKKEGLALINVDDVDDVYNNKNRSNRPWAIPDAYNIVWNMKNMNRFGLLTGKRGTILEPDIFDETYIDNLTKLNSLLSAMSEYIKKHPDLDLAECCSSVFKYPGFRPVTYIDVSGEDNPYNGIHNDCVIQPSGMSTSFVKEYTDCYLWECDRKKYLSFFFDK